MKAIISGLFSLTIVSSCAFGALPSPREQIESQLGCVKVSEAADDLEGSLEAKGYSSGSPGEKPVSTVFWCQHTKTDFLLVFQQDSSLFHAQCPPYLHWPWYPHGLKIAAVPQPLSEFVYLKDVLSADRAEAEGKVYEKNLRHGPKGETTIGMIVQDGVSSETQFYCYKGDWMVLQRD